MGDAGWLGRDPDHGLHVTVVEPAANHSAGGSRANLNARSPQAAADSRPRGKPENAAHDGRLADDLRCHAWSAIVASPQPDDGHLPAWNGDQSLLIRARVGRLVDVYVDRFIRHCHGPAFDVAVGQRKRDVVADNNDQFTPGPVLHVLAESRVGRE